MSELGHDIGVGCLIAAAVIGAIWVLIESALASPESPPHDDQWWQP